MLLTLRLLLIALLSVSAYAASEKEVEAFLKKGISKNPNIVSLDVKVVSKQPLKELKGWSAYTVEMKGKMRAGKDRAKDISHKAIYFVGGDFITPELINVKTGERLNESIAPEMTSAMYTHANLISGNSKSKHKVAIFSDPQCPYCKSFVPEAIEFMKKKPDTYAIYYYHFPLERIHPAAVVLTKAAIAAEQQGKKGVILKLYKVNIDARQSDTDKILKAFNKEMGTNITAKDLTKKSVMKQYESDQKIAQDLMVTGTPTMFFDGKKDNSRTQYKQVK